MNWWDAPEYDERRPMAFPDRTGGHTRPAALTTDPVMVRNKHGALRLNLKNRHPHERVRLYVGSRQAARA